MISLIVPVYNTQDKLAHCILSIKKQTYTDIEIFLINDGSSDNSLAICEYHAKTDSRIKVFTQENKGVSAARNVGIKNATSPYIIFVDSDDYIEKNMCEQMMVEASKEDFDIVVCGYFIHDELNIRHIRYPDKIYNGIKGLEHDFNQLYTQNFFNSPCNKLYKRSLIKNVFNEDLFLGEDLLFNLEYFREISKIKSSDKILYHYNMNHSISSLSSKYHSNGFEIAYQILNKMKKFCFDNEIEEKYSSGIYYQYFVTSYYNFQRLVYYSNKEFKEILEIISVWLQKDELQVSMKNISSLKGQLKLAKILMQLQSKYLLFCYFKFKKFFSRFV